MGLPPRNSRTLQTNEAVIRFDDVWIGFDEKKSLGAKETGARAALPIWMDFMKVALAGKDPGDFQPMPELPPRPMAEKVDTVDTAPAAEEAH